MIWIKESKTHAKGGEAVEVLASQPREPSLEYSIELTADIIAILASNRNYRGHIMYIT